MTSGPPSPGSDVPDSGFGPPAALPGQARAIFFEIPAGENAPRSGRQLLDDVMALWDCDDDDDVAALLTSELVTNVVRHARTDLLLEVSLRESLLRVAASDEDPTIPQLDPTVPDVTADSGRGLYLIDSLAHRWGIEPNTNGKTVWFDIVVKHKRIPSQRSDAPEH